MFLGAGLVKGIACHVVFSPDTWFSSCFVFACWHYVMDLPQSDLRGLGSCCNILSSVPVVDLQELDRGHQGVSEYSIHDSPGVQAWVQALDWRYLTKALLAEDLQTEAPLAEAPLEVRHSQSHDHMGGFGQC